MTVWVLLAAVILHLISSPLNKVEESFSMQAIHDFIHYGPHLEYYDHFQYPGVVPRSFVPVVFIGSIFSCLFPIWNWFVSHFQYLLQLEFFSYRPIDTFIKNHPLFNISHIPSGLVEQLFVRLLIGLISILCLYTLSKSLRKMDPKVINIWWLLLASQFHIPFYLSRTLQNTFAFWTVQLAFASWIKIGDKSKRDLFMAIFWMGLGGIILRSELILLWLPAVIWELLIMKSISFRRFVSYSLMVSIICLILTVSIDSFFWQKSLFYPEANVLYFNLILNKSHEWGTLPFHSYFSSLLPKLFIFQFPFVLFGLLLTKNKRELGWILSTLFFVFAYSFLPHKEWRFVWYVVPLWTFYAAKSISIIQKKFRYFLPSLFVSCLLVSIVMSWISAWNYPGGYALLKVSEMARFGDRIHMDVFTCESGASLFLEPQKTVPTRAFEFLSFSMSNYLKNISTPLTFYKDENLSLEELEKFDWLLVERKNLEKYNLKWKVKECIFGFRKLSFLRTTSLFSLVVLPRIAFIDLEQKICILQKNNLEKK